MAPTDERPAKRAKLMFLTTIEVVVGNLRVEYLVHKDILTERSIFFRNDVSSNAHGAGPTKVFLLDTCPTIFESYLHWAYSDKIVAILEDKKTAGSDDTVRLNQLVKLYILAHQLKDIRLKVRLTDMIEHHFDREGTLPWVQTITLIYNQLPSESKLRLLFLDKCGGHTHRACERPECCVYAKWLLKEWGNLPLDFVKDLVKMRMENTCGLYVEDRGGARAGCEYHEHNDEMPECPVKPPSHPDCYSCRF